MKQTTVLVALLVVGSIALAFGRHRAALGQAVDSPGVDAPRATASSRADSHGFLYGRVTTADGVIHPGRLRFGRDQEAFWGDYFNGSRAGNPWARYAPASWVESQRRPIEILGFEIPILTRQTGLDRPFMVRFGDIIRIDAPSVRRVRVTLRSGGVFDLNRNAASDFDDGLRVWDDSGHFVDLASWAGGIPPPSQARIRSIEFLPTTPLAGAPARLHGTVRTPHGDFSG